MTMRIGTAPVSWGIMEVDTSWGRPQTFGSVLDEMVSGTELRPWGSLPTGSEAFEQAWVAGLRKLVEVPVSEVSEMPSVRKCVQSAKRRLAKNEYMFPPAKVIWDATC